MKRRPKTALFITASHPFPLRNRCANCGSDKLCYFQDYTNPYQYPNVKYSRERSLASTEGWIRWTPTDVYNVLHKRAGTRIDPSHSVRFKGYAPKFSRSWSGVQDQKRYHVSNMVVVVACQECDLHTWVYMNSNIRKMPENFNRKARINCPQKIMPLQWRK